MHQKFTRGHQILQKADFQSLGPDGSLPCFPTERCSLHKNEVVSIYCKDHDEVMCTTCIALSITHRYCKNIISIAEEAENLYQGINVKDVQQKIVQTKKSMQDIKTTKQSTIQELRAALDHEIETVKASRQEFKVLLDDMEHKTIQDLQKEFSKIEESLTDEINKVESLESSLNEVASQLKKSEGNKAQEFVSVKSSERIITKGQETENSHLTATIETISFTPDPSIKAFLQQHKSLGKVSIKKLELKVYKDKPGSEDPSNKLDVKFLSTSTSIMQENSLNNAASKETINEPNVDASINKAESIHTIQNFESEVSTNQSQRNASINKAVSKDNIYRPENLTCKPNDDLYRVNKKRDVNVKLKSDRYNCAIRGCCVTEDGYLLLTDWNNNKLKRLDMSTEKVKDYLDLTGKPFAVCTVSKTKVAVTLDNQSIQFVSLLRDKMTAARTLTMNHDCYGIAHIEGKLFISDDIKTVYIYDMNGQQQRRVTRDGLDTEIFRRSWHIAVSVSGDKVFVTDMDKGLVVLDCQGNYLSTHKNDNISDYAGVCTDGRNVFVSDRNLGNIVQFGPDFSKLGEITNFGRWSGPYSMTFDHQNKRLFATFLNNAITIMQLS